MGLGELGETSTSESLLVLMSMRSWSGGEVKSGSEGEVESGSGSEVESDPEVRSGRSRVLGLEFRWQNAKRLCARKTI